MSHNGSNPLWKGITFPSKKISIHFKRVLPLVPNKIAISILSLSSISEGSNKMESYKDKFLSACEGLLFKTEERSGVMPTPPPASWARTSI